MKTIKFPLFTCKSEPDYVRIKKVLKYWNGDTDYQTLRELCAFAETCRNMTFTQIIEQFREQDQAPFIPKKPSKPTQEQTLPTIEPSIPVRDESLRERLFKAVLEREGTPNFTGQNLKELNEGFHQLINENLFPDSFEEQVEFLWQCI